jgi:hypothetical protein
VFVNRKICLVSLILQTVLNYNVSLMRIGLIDIKFLSNKPIFFISF